MESAEMKRMWPDRRLQIGKNNALSWVIKLAVRHICDFASEKGMQTGLKSAVLFKRCGKYEFSHMENGTITLSEALEIMRRRDSTGRLIHFNITWRTFSASNRTGGKYRAEDGVTCLVPGKKNADTTINIYNLLEEVKATKDPKHYKHFTRNIKLPCGSKRKVNILFIISINDQKVIY
jgi:hypothetical protein